MAKRRSPMISRLYLPIAVLMLIAGHSAQGQRTDVVVFNEILSHSHDEAPDWIELLNTSAAPVDVSGWFLSDSESELRKYQIADGTVIQPNGFLVLYENEAFGHTSEDPGKLEAFALSENGEIAYLYAPASGTSLEYLVKETFGPSPTSVSRGRYVKSTNATNFIAMTEPTPGTPNSAPLVGPIVISEIMYHPSGDGDAEYLELTNITGEPFTLFDPKEELPWRFTSGIEFEFPENNPVTFAPGECILLVRDKAAFLAQFTIPADTQLFQWSNLNLSNGGEQIELSMPGDVDEDDVRHWIRMDRVNYGDSDLWPIEADGNGLSLTRIDERAYGNDVINWTAASPTPGLIAESEPRGFEPWATDNNLPLDASGFEDDADGDGISNGLEYALGLDPVMPSLAPPIEMSLIEGDLTLSMNLPQLRSDVRYTFEISEDLTPGQWRGVETVMVSENPVSISADLVRSISKRHFVRLSVQYVSK